ncbi:MAG: hypothetical protein ACYC8T_35290 [Myxococcaceae bacterium]
MLERDSIQHGMSVRGPRGEFFGRVVACGPRHFVVRRSVWTRKRAAVAYADVAGLRRGMVWLRRGGEALLPEGVAAGEGPLMSVLPLDPSRDSVPEAIA